MNIEFDYEIEYRDSPFSTIRVSLEQRSFNTEAIFDTGADVSIFDAKVADALALRSENAQRWMTVVGVLGRPERVPVHDVTISLIGSVGILFHVDIGVGFLDGLADSVGGNLLGLNFFDRVDFAVSHSKRRIYLRQVATSL